MSYATNGGGGGGRKRGVLNVSIARYVICNM